MGLRNKVEFEAYLEAQVFAARARLKELEADDIRLGERRGSAAWEDVTDQAVQDLREDLGALNRLLLDIRESGSSVGPNPNDAHSGNRSHPHHKIHTIFPRYR
jgi:hypothetical protein